MLLGVNILEGIVVVSVEQAVAAPLATRQLADLGARVIKIERPGQGDFARGYDDTVHGLSSHFVWLNRGKESVQLDPKSDLGQQAIGALVARADVFVNNVAPGAASRLGLDAPTLRARHPGLVHVSISGYGSGGPYSDKKAYDLLVQCETGLVSITGTQADPAKVGISVADIAAGMYAYTGVLTALLRRGRTSEGATVEVSMLEALGEWMGFPLNYTLYGDQDLERSGAAHAAIAPYGPFRCGDGQQVFLGVQNEREWSVLCTRVLGRPELADDPRFATVSRRVEARADLTRHIEDAFEARSARDVADQLQEADIAHALLRDMRSFADHPQLAARGRWVEHETPGGTVRALIPPVTIDQERPVMGAVPDVGEHTAAVLAELGLAPEPA